MLRVTFRSLLARKLRLLLSATAIVLGVSFVSGALTLTDTLGRVFDTLFVSVNAKTDVEVRGPEIFTGGGELRAARAGVGGVALPGRGRPRGRPGRRRTCPATPSCSTGTGRPTPPAERRSSGSTSTRTRGPRPSPWWPAGRRAARTRWPWTSPRPSGSGIAPGDAVRIQLTSGLQDFTMTGTFGFGTSDSVGGAAIVAFDPETAQQLVGRPGEYDLVRVAGDDGTDPSVLRERVAGVLPAGYEAVPGEQSAQRAPTPSRSAWASSRSSCSSSRDRGAVRRRLSHLQHLHDPGRPAAARARPAARARREPAAGDHQRRGRGAGRRRHRLAAGARARRAGRDRAARAGQQLRRRAARRVRWWCPRAPCSPV